MRWAWYGTLMAAVPAVLALGLLSADGAALGPPESGAAWVEYAAEGLSRRAVSISRSGRRPESAQGGLGFLGRPWIEAQAHGTADPQPDKSAGNPEPRDPDGADDACRGLAREFQELRAEIRELKRDLDQSTLDRARIEAPPDMEHWAKALGLVPVHGPGVRVVISDKPSPPEVGEDPVLGIVHQEDLLKLVNELYAAGAEAVSINEQRLNHQSWIRCVGPTVMVNEKRIAAPFVIKAIGDPELLYKALSLRGGTVQTLRHFGMEARLERARDLSLPAVEREPTFDYARVREKDRVLLERFGQVRVEEGEAPENRGSEPHGPGSNN